ncbi:MAG: T9SS type A sorting domain-containing protein [Bacteroidetes bacterium]|nr:T9SS type A sorting domain-containing protein [Bacteroidota bacterium]
MQVFDLNGREILSSIFNTTTEFSFPDNIPSGIYVIRVFNSKVIFTSRISLTR